jgi:hypothetical protein
MQLPVDEFKEAWAGVLTYDSLSKQNFSMRAAYHDSIHDYPAMGMFTCWATHGGLTCIVCKSDIDTTWLPNGHKFSWFDCHRRFLPPDHHFMTQKNAFRNGAEVHELPLRLLAGEEVLAYLNQAKATSFQGFGTTHNWTVISNWWELPYFSQLLYPHNIDVMHTEKNVTKVVFNTILDIPDKTKDNAMARHDKTLICNRKQLNLVEKPNDRWERSRAAFCLTRSQGMLCNGL